MKIFQRLAHADAHHRFLIAAGLSALMFAGLTGHFTMIGHIFITWDFFSFCMLSLVWLTILNASPRTVRHGAKLQDSSYTAIFAFVVISACASLLALGVLLGEAKDLSRGLLTERILLSVITVVCSWTLVHTVFAMRYAHAFYGTGPSARLCGGLDFPDTKEPDYLDFAYFSFVIGMTFQVSDVVISSRSIRHLALIHSLVSFAFNMVILALTVNIISGLL